MSLWINEALPLIAGLVGLFVIGLSFWALVSPGITINLGPFGFCTFHIGDYMRRWIFRHPLGTVRVHYIRKPDADPDLHDHPWDFASLILWGGYTEDIPIPGTQGRGRQQQTYGPGSISFKRATDAHRIVSVRGPTCTLVLSGRMIRTWGYWTTQGFVPWRAYRCRQGKGIDAAAYDRRLWETGLSE